MSRVIFLIQLSIVLAMIIQSCRADKCKKKIRAIMYDRCNLRSKRSSPFIFDSDEESVDEQKREKRQIMSIREIFVASRVPIYHHMPYPSYVRHEYTPAVPPGVHDYYRMHHHQQHAQTASLPKAESLPQESHSEVGFEMSYEEMIELFDEFYDRLPRGTKSREEMHKTVLPFIEECCKNIDLCRMKKDCPYN